LPRTILKQDPSTTASKLLVPPTEFDIERRSAGDSRAAVAFGVSTCSRENSGLDYGVANLALFTGPLRIRTRACEGRFGSMLSKKGLEKPSEQ